MGRTGPTSRGAQLDRHRGTHSWMEALMEARRRMWRQEKEGGEDGGEDRGAHGGKVLEDEFPGFNPELKLTSV